MEFGYSKEHVLLRDLYRKFAETEVKPLAEELDEEEIMMLALESGAEDMVSEENVLEIITDPDVFDSVKAAVTDAGVEILEGEVTMLPNVTTSLDLEISILFQKLVDKLLEDEDVDNVYHNAEFHEEFEG